MSKNRKKSPSKAKKPKPPKRKKGWDAPAIRDIDTKHYYDSHYKAVRAKPKAGRQRGVLHPSQLLKCRRQQQFELLYVKPAKTELFLQLFAIFDNGHSAEARMRKALESGMDMYDVKFSPSIKVFDESTLIGGETDGVVELTNGERWVLDFKTANRERYTSIITAPAGYVAQMHAYMHCLKIPQSVLFFENKDSNATKQIVVRWDQNLWDNLMEEVIDYILEHTIDELLVPMDEDNCEPKNCPYHRICFEEPEFEDVDARPPKARRRLKVIADEHFNAPG